MWPIVNNIWYIIYHQSKLQIIIQENPTKMYTIITPPKITIHHYTGPAGILQAVNTVYSEPYYQRCPYYQGI